tara:strand:- start:431 stop:604 length:174 start_codon:yes stop_codon:yes gene_type:complete
MSEQERKLEQKSKLAVFVPLALLVAGLLFLSSCGNASYCMQNEALNPLKNSYSRACR